MKDEDALICDMAERYHVLDYKALPLRLLATLAVGLPDDSRSKRRLTGDKAGLELTLLAGIFDKLSLLLWAQTKDGAKNRNRPEMVLSHLLPSAQNKDEALEVFNSSEAFKAQRERFLQEVST